MLFKAPHRLKHCSSVNSIFWGGGASCELWQTAGDVELLASMSWQGPQHHSAKKRSGSGSQSFQGFFWGGEGIWHLLFCIYHHHGGEGSHELYRKSGPKGVHSWGMSAVPHSLVAGTGAVAPWNLSALMKAVKRRDWRVMHS